MMKLYKKLFAFLLICAIIPLGSIGCAQGDGKEQTVVDAHLFSENPSEDVLTAPKSDGVYLVGHEIALGAWQSDAEAGEECYWVRRKYDAIVRGEFYGKAGGVMQIVEGDYEVEMHGCGVWTYLVE